MNIAVPICVLNMFTYGLSKMDDSFIEWKKN